MDMHILKQISSFVNKEIFVFSLLTACSILAIGFVNLTPQVDENFFFSSQDTKFQEEKHISRIFKRRDTQLILNAKGDIQSPFYSDQIRELTEKIISVPGVISALSITRGPSGIRDVLTSPLWKRLLLSDNNDATNIIVILSKERQKNTVDTIESLIRDQSKPGFKLQMSGAPYIVKLIQRHLVRDFKIFSLLAFLMFGLTVFLIFRSPAIVAGTLLSCLNAAIWTLMLADLANIQIGLLTANLATIIFVLTLSHIVYLTYNWRTSGSNESPAERTKNAVHITFVPSFWSMFTTLLGFLTLLTVPAKPLKELGVSGAIGCVVAFITAYTIYPCFLRAAKFKTYSRDFLRRAASHAFRRLEQKKTIIAYSMISLAIITYPGLWFIKHDPSIFAYFKKNSEISQGLSYIDRNGGSNPLIIVISDPSGKKLNTTNAYRKMWNLQEALEKNESVGTVLSLPVLMAQAKRSPFAFFLSWEWMLEILESPKYHQITKSFTTDDRKNGLFLLRMKELNRDKPRLDIIEELKDIVRENGFETENIGGIYALQGHMSKLVLKSLVSGLWRLLLLFFIIGLFLTRSLKISFAMTASIVIVAIIVLGSIGIMRMPFDVIAAPAINIALAMGIDAMIHMIQYWKRLKGKNTQQHEWDKIRRHLWGPVTNSMFIIMMGFGIFLFSQFPPTQRFGASILMGSFLSAFGALFLMSWIAASDLKKIFPRKKTS